jgi:hypothetical protein
MLPRSSSKVKMISASPNIRVAENQHKGVYATGKKNERRAESCAGASGLETYRRERNFSSGVHGTQRQN